MTFGARFGIVGTAVVTALFHSSIQRRRVVLIGCSRFLQMIAPGELRNTWRGDQRSDGNAHFNYGRSSGTDRSAELTR